MMTFGPKFIGLHSFPKEMQLQKRDVSFGCQGRVHYSGFQEFLELKPSLYWFHLSCNPEAPEFKPTQQKVTNPT